MGDNEEDDDDASVVLLLLVGGSLPATILPRIDAAGNLEDAETIARISISSSLTLPISSYLLPPPPPPDDEDDDSCRMAEEKAANFDEIFCSFKALNSSTWRRRKC